MATSNPREGDERTSVLLIETTSRRLTIGQLVEELVKQLTRASEVADGMVLGNEAYRIAYELEQSAELPAGSVEDRLPTDSEPTVGDVIRCGIAAYEAARPKSSWFWHWRYVLPG